VRSRGNLIFRDTRIQFPLKIIYIPLHYVPILVVQFRYSLQISSASKKISHRRLTILISYFILLLLFQGLGFRLSTLICTPAVFRASECWITIPIPDARQHRCTPQSQQPFVYGTVGDLILGTRRTSPYLPQMTLFPVSSAAQLANHPCSVYRLTLHYLNTDCGLCLLPNSIRVGLLSMGKMLHGCSTILSKDMDMESGRVKCRYKYFGLDASEECWL
jgi:hypothetical protein